MSDRPQGSVRTASPAGDAAAPGSTAAGEAVPVSATQSIPTTGSQRAQAPADEAPTTTGGPSGAPSGAPPVPPTAPDVAPASGGSTVMEGTGRDATATDVTGKDVTGGDVTGKDGASKPTGRSRIRGAGRGPRRARLQLRHIDTWSALKISLVLSIALFFIWMVAVGVLYGVLSALDVFDTLNELFGQIGSASGTEASGDVVTPGLVFGGAAIIGAINIVLMTALCTVGTFIYNLCSDLVGGLELTLSERD
jgi:hypothetical protein